MEYQNAKIENLTIAANCNTVFHALAFNQSQKIIAYAAANAVLIMDPYHTDKTVPKVLFSLKGHTDRVNSVMWLSERILVSVSTDKSMIIWGYTEGSNPRDYQNWTFKKGYANIHKESINYLRTYQCKDKELYILTMAAEGTLKLWQGTSENDISLKSELLFGKNLQEAMNIFKISDKHLLLAVGGYDSNIHIYLVPRMSFQKEGQKMMKYKFSLLGHFNSIRDLTFTDLLHRNVICMASCSQDNNIRIWKIQPLENISESFGGHEDLKQYESKTSYVLQDDEETKVYNITLESVLVYHQESVSSVQWQKRSDIEKTLTPSLKDYCLISSSFDFTVCIWKADPETMVWNVDSTLGAMAGNKHAFFGAMFLEDDQNILSYTYNGAMNQWKRKADGDTQSWIPQLTVKGHFGDVSDIDWDQHELYLMSTSQDQTTRVVSQYAKDKGWFEFGRPQVHGYDMNALASLKVNSTAKLPSKILSGGDEKVLRLFEAPFSFVKTFNLLHPLSREEKLQFSETRSNEEIEKLIGTEAKKQPLGLMNKPTFLASEKAIVDEEEGGLGGEFDPKKVLSNVKDKKDELIEDLEEPPVEDILMSKTLWPEQQKLYGHAFEIFAVATSHAGDCAASSCKAKEKKYADIIIWDLRKGHTTVPSCKLAAHNLTVVQLEFSKDDQYLLSCSRDRSWALFIRASPDSLNFELLRKEKDAHSRIIWGITWSHDNTLFATASREKSKSIKVWKGVVNTDKSEFGKLFSELPEENPSATAIRFFPSLVRRDNYSLIVGLETGDIRVWMFSKAQETWQKLFVFPEYLSQCATVRKIKFNKRLSCPEKDEYTVATCGNDQCTRLFKLTLQ